MFWDVCISGAEGRLKALRGVPIAALLRCGFFETPVVHQELGLTDFTRPLVLKFKVKIA